MNRNSDGKKTIKSSIYYVIANIISVIVSLFTVSILTNLMSTQDMGMATTFVTLQTVISYVILLTIYSSINRAMLEKKIDFDKYLSTITIFSILVVFLYFIVYWIFKKSINQFFGYNTYLMIFLFLTVLFNNILLFLYTKWNFKNLYIKCFIYNILISPVSQVISLVLVAMLATEKYTGRIVGLQILQVILGLLACIYILFKGKFKFERKYVKYALIISFPTMWHLLSQVLLSNSDLLMIKSMCGASDAGIYSIAYTISNVFFIAIVSILKPWSPWVYRRMENNEIDSISNNSKYIIILSFILCLGLISISPEMIKMFLNKEYFKAIYLIAPLCIGMFFQVIYILFYDIEYYYKANKNIAIYSCIAAVINIVLNIIFINKFGYQAAAYTTLFSYFILAVFHFLGMKKLDNRSIFDIKQIVKYSLLLVMCSVINMVFINNILVRYGLMIIVFVVVVIINLKEIRKMIGNFGENRKKQKI